VLCQVIQEKEAIRMRALQDIEMVIRSVVEEIITAQPEDYGKHRNAFEISMGNDPSAKYGVQAVSEDTDEYLWKHAKEFANMANIDLDQFPLARDRIDLAIQQAKQKVNKMESASKACFGATLYQQQENQQKQQQQQLTQQRAFNYTSPQGNQPISEKNYASESLALGQQTALVLDPSWRANSLLSGRLEKVVMPTERPDLKGLLIQGRGRLSEGDIECMILGNRKTIPLPQPVRLENIIMGIDRLSVLQDRGPKVNSFEQPRQAKRRQTSDLKWLEPNLYLMPNFFQTTTTSNPEEDLKPTTFILATLDLVTGRRDYRVISTEDARIYSAQLQDQQRRGQVQQTGFIFTSNGAIHQTDRSASGLSSTEIEEWQGSDEFRKVLAQIGLIDGRRIEDAWQWELVQQHPEAIEDLKIIWENHLLRSDTTFQKNTTSLLNMLKRPLLQSSFK
jgi:hypothetical protein